MFKKIITTALTLALGLQCTSAYAAENNNYVENLGNNVYQQELVENIELNGSKYTYSYSYNSEGNRVVEIKNNINNQSDILVFDKNSSTIIKNNETLGKVESSYKVYTDNNYSLIEKSTGTSSWPHFASSTDKISWKKGTTVAVVAGAISVVLGSLGASGVIGAIGSNTISTLASNAIGGTVYQDIHKFNSTTISQYKNTWKFTASTGSTYGPYVYMF